LYGYIIWGTCLDGWTTSFLFLLFLLPLLFLTTRIISPSDISYGGLPDKKIGRVLSLPIKVPTL